MGRPAIVIFGAAVRSDGSASTALRRRVAAAVACGRRMPDALYVPTGGIGRHGPAEAEVMAALLRDLGIAAAAILAEPTAADTLASVRAVRRLLGRHDGPVYAATDAYHLPRCLLLLRLAGLPAHRCGVDPCDVPGPPSRNLWRRWYWRLREVPALPLDAALMLALRITGRV